MREPRWPAERARSALLHWFDRMPGPLACALVAGAIAASWSVGYAIGGANRAAPHWFYLPVLFAAARFGVRGGMLAGTAAGLGAGPLLPGDVTAGLAQPPVDWVTRASFFVVLGITMAVLVAHSRAALLDEVHALRAERELRRAIQARQFVVHYQPVVSLETGAIVGAEALVRWQHTQRGLVPPSEFIPLAEQSGLVRELGDLVLADATQRAREWSTTLRSQGRNLVVSVNVSPRQLEDPEFGDRVRALSRGLPRGTLCVEITEAAVIADLAEARGELERLRAHGVCVAIDDYGTGQASLSYLHRLPADVVKIDRTFVATLDRFRGEKIVKAVIDLAGEVGMRPLAEGVETVAQAERLLALGCELGQGFLFSPAVPPEEFDRLLRSGHAATARGVPARAVVTVSDAG